MTLEVTMLIWSGREDPHWTLDGAQENEFRRLIESSAFDSARPIRPWQMGYRGFRVVDPDAPQQRQLRLLDHTLPEFDFYGAPEVEQFLLDTAPPDDPDTPFELPVSRDLRFPDLKALPPVDLKRRLPIEPRITVQPSKAVDAKAWNPADPKWVFQLGGGGNCNSYATNRIDRGSPGEVQHGGVGELYTNRGWGYGIGGASMLSAVLWDGLVKTAGPSQQLVAGEGFHCCLVMKPGADQHWYRQDADGWWSHKLGGSQPTRLDGAGKPIADPRSCDRGPYTVFIAWLRMPRDGWRPPEP